MGVGASNEDNKFGNQILCLETQEYLLLVMLNQVNSAVFYLRIYPEQRIQIFLLIHLTCEIIMKKKLEKKLLMNCCDLTSILCILVSNDYYGSNRCVCSLTKKAFVSILLAKKKLKKNPLIEVKWQRHNKVLFCNRSMSKYIRTLNAFDIGLDFGFYFTYFAFACAFDVCS